MNGSLEKFNIAEKVCGTCNQWVGVRIPGGENEGVLTLKGFVGICQVRKQLTPTEGKIDSRVMPSSKACAFWVLWDKSTDPYDGRGNGLMGCETIIVQRKPQIGVSS